MIKSSIKYLTSFAIVVLLMGGLSGNPWTHVFAEETITVSFSIINDDQTIDSQVLATPSIITAPIVTHRNNVRLDGWYLGPDLDEAFNFSLPVNNSLTLYAQWDYLIDTEGKALLTMSDTGDTFESGKLTLVLNLFEPLQDDVTYQWQMKLTAGDDWRDISGATTNQYQPLRNGYHGYRLVYRTPIYDGMGQQIDDTRHETQAVWVTITGEFPWLALIIALSFLLMFTVIYFLSYRWPMLLFVDSAFFQVCRYRGQEDVSDTPEPTREGYRFDGWYRDETLTIKDTYRRMPYRPIKRFGHFVKEAEHEPN